MSQMTIKLQLDMLWKLIELTDPIFAQYLGKCCVIFLYIKVIIFFGYSKQRLCQLLFCLSLDRLSV